MALNLMYITNNPKVAVIAEKAGVDRIFIDLEILGKEERQGHLDTVISRHSLDDVRRIKSILKKSKLLVRVNPINMNSEIEIDKVIKSGADIVMLPMFKTVKEVELFISYVNNRAKTSLLLETKEAVECLEKILKIKGINEVHIGLNDLHLSYGKKFMFELLSEGLVEQLCKVIKRHNIIYGFGGVAKIGSGNLPAEYIIGEHYRLGSSQVILGRSFINEDEWNNNGIEVFFKEEVSKIRNREKLVNKYSDSQYDFNKKEVRRRVEKILEKLEILN